MLYKTDVRRFQVGQLLFKLVCFLMKIYKDKNSISKMSSRLFVFSIPQLLIKHVDTFKLENKKISD